MSKRCSANNRTGERCGAWAAAGLDKCALHSDPGLAAKMGSKHGRRATCPSQPDAAPMLPTKTAGDVRDALANTILIRQVLCSAVLQLPTPVAQPQLGLG